MASTGRHRPPPAATATSSSSTLSPLAPPFTVDRRTLHAHDYPSYFTTPAVVSSDLVLAEPFYPHYDRRGGGLWNGPFDEGVGEAPVRDSFSSSPSLSSSSSSAWIGAGSSAASPQGGLSDVFAVESIWCSNQADTYGRKYFESDHQGWQQDKPSVQTRGSVSNPVCSSGSVFSPLELADASFNYFPSEAFSKGLCDTPSSASHYYFGSTMQNGSYRGKEVGFRSATTYCPQAHFSQSFSESNSLVEKDPKVERYCVGKVDLFEKYAHSRRRVSVSIREPDMKSNVDIADNCVQSNGMSDNIKKTDAIPLHLEKENPASAHDLCAEDPQTKLHAKSDLTITSFAASSSVETGNFDQTTEMVDQLNLAEDSPCWKGAAIVSRQSPFHIVNTSTGDSSTVDKKFDDCNGKTVEGATPKDSVLDSLLDPLERKKEVSYSDDFTVGFQAKGCDDSLLNRRVISSSTTHSLFQNEMAFEPVSKPLDGSSYSSCQTWGTSLSGVSHIGRPIAPPKSSDLSATSTKFWDGHFLFRSLCDLSAFCLSYSSNGNVLNENEYELLSMTRHNVEACLSKRSVAGEKRKCQYGPSQVEVPQIEGNICLSKCKDRGMPEMPKMQPLHSDIDCDTYGGHLLPDGCLAWTEDIAKNFVKSVSKTFNGGEEDTELNLYKKLWIEAEAALCRMKYELHFARAKMEPQHHQQKTPKAMQDSSGAEELAEQIRIASFIASQPDLNIDNDLISVTRESQAVGLNLDNDASSPKLEQVSTSGVRSATEDVSAVMDRFRVLIARANKVDSSNMGSPDKLHDCITVNPDLEGKPSPSNPSCSDGELGSGTFSQRKLDAGTCLQPRPLRLDTGGNPSVSARVPEQWHLEAASGSYNSPGGNNLVSARVPELWHVEAASGSYNSQLMGCSQRQTPLSEGVEGGGRFAGFHEKLGERVVIDSYIPENGWHANKFQGGKQGSNSSDWEHVREEDVVW